MTERILSSAIRKRFNAKPFQCLKRKDNLEKLIELSPAAIYVVDKQGYITNCNSTFLKYYPQYTKDTVIGSSYKTLAEQKGRNYSLTTVARALQGNEIINEYDYVLDRYWIRHAFPLRGGGGEVVGAIAISNDITDMEKLKRDVGRLDRLNVVGQMAASLAHEVRNPMTVLRGYVQNLLVKTGDTYKSQFQTVITELDRVNQVLNDFLALTRNSKTDKSEVNLNTLITELLPLIEAESLSRKIRCRFSFTQLPALRLNSTEVKQLLLNLCLNSFDAMNEGGELGISTDKSDCEVTLSISDTGCGIDPETLKKIFEPFYTTKPTGTGLGLAECKRIADNHGAKIAVASAAGAGSTFTVRFPLLS